MRIQGPKQPHVSIVQSKDSDAKASKAESAIAASKGGDTVTLGSSAKTLSAGHTSRLEPEIQARLSQVREQLRNNEYAIDYEKLASNILGDEVARAGASE